MKRFKNKKYTDKLAWYSLKLVCVITSNQWSTLDGGCTDFSRVVKPKIEKMGTLKKNGDPMGTHNLKKVPMGTRVPKWGPTWEQCY